MSWADGAAGIVLPTPVAVGHWPAQDLGLAEQEVRKTLIAAHLDDTMLVRHDPAAFLGTLAPNARSGEPGPSPTRGPGTTAAW